MGMHFKLGLYEHQSAGALQGIIDLIAKNPSLLNDARGEHIKEIRILAYEPAFGIIGNPAKMDPKTRQSADHSMAYIVATLLRKALESKAQAKLGGNLESDRLWKTLMLSPYDYKEDESAIFHPLTRSLMKKIKFEHGGPEYDRNYPDGIPTSLVVQQTGNLELEGHCVDSRLRASLPRRIQLNITQRGRNLNIFFLTSV
jgi:2-methylcitrate dehydratase